VGDYGGNNIKIEKGAEFFNSFSRITPSPTRKMQAKFQKNFKKHFFQKALTNSNRPCYNILIIKTNEPPPNNPHNPQKTA